MHKDDTMLQHSMAVLEGTSCLRFTFYVYVYLMYTLYVYLRFAFYVILRSFNCSPYLLCHAFSFSITLSLSLSISSCSLFVTIPCACVSIFYFKWGLPSLAASVVIGYMVSGAFNSVTLLLSDWEYISYRVMIRNGATEPVEDDEDDDEDSDVDVGNVGNDAGVNKRWNLLQYMRGGNTNNEPYNDDEKNVSFISVKSNQKKYADADADDADDADDDGSTGTNNTEITSGVIKKSSSRWLTFGRDHEENELRRVVLGPGKLGYTIQSTKVN